MPQNRKKGTTPPIWASQNFLTSYKTINRIIRRTPLNENDYVIEIGSGKGHTTGFLIKRCRKVLAIEIDGRLYDKLTAKFKDVKNIRICHQDFLKWKLPKHEDYKVFSNIPFCFTTDIMRKLTECKNAPSEAWLTMEKGAANVSLHNRGLYCPAYTHDIRTKFATRSYYGLHFIHGILLSGQISFI